MTHAKKVWHLDDKGWRQITMEAIDAHHAVAVDPKHWSFADPKASTLESPEMDGDES